MLKDGISVIICCYNSGWIISRCLEALKAQKVREGLPWEVVLVDNNCTDDTVERATTTMAGSSVDFHIVQEKEPGLLNARKKGIREVKYAYTIYCDDDNLLCPEYVDTMYGILSSDPKIGAAGGKGIAEFECEPDPRILKYITCYATGSQMKRKGFLVGAGLAVRTELVRDIYDNQKMYLTGRMGKSLLSGDDSELTKSLLLRGYSLHPTDDITYTHVLKSNRLTWEYKEQMFEGFMRAVPALSAMDIAINGGSFFDIFTDYRISLLVYLKYVIFFWKDIAPEARRTYGNMLSYYHQWGFFKLWRIYKDSKRIKTTNKTLNNNNMPQR